VKKEESSSAAKATAEVIQEKVYPDRVYLSMKKDACSKCTLLCQIEDHQRVKFTGDAGAIGRLTVKEGSDMITIDLKGKYATCISQCIVVYTVVCFVTCD
jgi:hypothetical protein